MQIVKILDSLFFLEFFFTVTFVINNIICDNLVTKFVAICKKSITVYIHVVRAIFRLVTRILRSLDWTF